MINWQDRANPQAGGAEAHLHEIFGRLATRGHAVTLLASGWPGAPARDRLDGIDVWRAGSRHTFPLHVRGAYHSIGQRFDLVVEDLNKVPMFTPRWVRAPVVLLVHHLFGRTAFQEATFPLAAATWLLERPLSRAYRGLPVEAVSQSTADDLVRRGFDRRTITVIPNGIDHGTFRPDPAGHRFDEPTVLYLGRLKRYKRVDLVLEALARLVADGVRVRGIIAGQGDHAAELRALRDRLNLRHVVEMPGFVTEAEKLRLLQRAWVHVLASPKEGWGITNLEAAACGTPTVASDSPGLRDSVGHGATGLLVPHGDVAALADGLRRILEDEVLRGRLSSGARAFAAGFSWERSADLTEAHLNDVVRAAPGTATKEATPGADAMKPSTRRR